jgi:pectinesterase
MRRSLSLSLLLAVGTLACGSDSLPNGPDAGLDSGTEAGLADVTIAPAPDAAATVDSKPAIDVGLVQGCPVPPASTPTGTPTWETLAGFKSPTTFYTSPGGIWVAENLIYYQNTDGGWPKAIDMSQRTTARNNESMIDNDATTTQIRYMANMIGAWPECQRYRDSFDKGMGWIWNAQYPGNGGWPQAWPLPHASYAKHITYNDGAMVKVMQILRDIARGDALYKFLDQATVAKAATALGKGVDCILKTQIVAGGVKTGWCAQHDEVTLAPALARSYELPSLSGSEGAGILGFLLTLDLARPDLPKQDIIDAVEAAVRFYASVKILGFRWTTAATDAGPTDNVLVAAPGATPLWARFYELEPPFRPSSAIATGSRSTTWPRSATSGAPATRGTAPGQARSSPPTRSGPPNGPQAATCWPRPSTVARRPPSTLARN